jgi:hypothetical protein
VTLFQLAIWLLDTPDMCVPERGDNPLGILAAIGSDSETQHVGIRGPVTGERKLKKAMVTYIAIG